MLPIIGVTIGDPAGVGPEIVLKAAQKLSKNKTFRLVVFGDYALLSHVSKKVLRRNLSPNIELMDFKNVKMRGFGFGKATASNGRASGDYIEAAVGAAQNKMIDAVVTAPINKVSFNMGGWGKKYIGHTEMLAGLTHTKDFALMMLCGKLRAIHVTSHIPLKKVSTSITPTRVLETIRLAHLGLTQIGVRHPRIAVCGLNPHAGDEGLMGSEEKRVIAPAVKRALNAGFRVIGPLSADIVWPQVLGGKYDVGVAIYHDQGQIPVKLLGFNAKSGDRTLVEGVNLTIGLPIIRSSVAHGTAYEIAGKGVASERSLIQAIELAVTMVKNKIRK